MKKASAAKNSEVPADFLETYVWHYSLLSSSSHNLAYVPGPTFGLMKLLASSGSHCTKCPDKQHRPAGFESRLVPDLPLPFIPTLIGLQAFDLVSSRVWWEAVTSKQRSPRTLPGATRLHEVESYIIEVAFTSPPL